MIEEGRCDIFLQECPNVWKVDTRQAKKSIPLPRPEVRPHVEALSNRNATFDAPDSSKRQ